MTLEKALRLFATPACGSVKTIQLHVKGLACPFNLADRGIAIFGIDLGPRWIESTPDQVREYLNISVRHAEDGL